MPRLVALGYKWHTSSDILLLLTGFQALIHISFLIPFITGVWTLNTAQADVDCPVHMRVWVTEYGLMLLFFVAGVVELAATAVGLQGGPLEARRRWAFAPLMLASVVLVVAIVALSIFGSAVLEEEMDHRARSCWNSNPCVFAGSDLQDVCADEAGFGWAAWVAGEGEEPNLTGECQAFFDGRDEWRECHSQWLTEGEAWVQAAIGQAGWGESSGAAAPVPSPDGYVCLGDAAPAPSPGTWMGGTSSSESEVGQASLSDYARGAADAVTEGSSASPWAGGEGAGRGGEGELKRGGRGIGARVPIARGGVRASPDADPAPAPSAPPPWSELDGTSLAPFAGRVALPTPAPSSPSPQRSASAPAPDPGPPRAPPPAGAHRGLFEAGPGTTAGGWPSRRGVGQTDGGLTGTPAAPSPAPGAQAGTAAVPAGEEEGDDSASPERQEAALLQVSNSTGTADAPWARCLSSQCQALLTAADDCGESSWTLEALEVPPSETAPTFRAIIGFAWSSVALVVAFGLILFNVFPDEETEESWEGTVHGLSRCLCCSSSLRSAKGPEGIDVKASTHIARALTILLGSIDLDPTDRVLAMLLSGATQSVRRRSQSRAALAAAAAREGALGIEGEPGWVARASPSRDGGMRGGSGPSGGGGAPPPGELERFASEQAPGKGPQPWVREGSFPSFARGRRVETGKPPGDLRAVPSLRAQARAPSLHLTYSTDGSSTWSRWADGPGPLDPIRLQSEHLRSPDLPPLPFYPIISLAIQALGGERGGKAPGPAIEKVSFFWSVAEPDASAPAAEVGDGAGAPIDGEAGAEAGEGGARIPLPDGLEQGGLGGSLRGSRADLSHGAGAGWRSPAALSAPQNPPVPERVPPSEASDASPGRPSSPDGRAPGGGPAGRLRLAWRYAPILVPPTFSVADLMAEMGRTEGGGPRARVATALRSLADKVSGSLPRVEGDVTRRALGLIGSASAAYALKPALWMRHDVRTAFARPLNMLLRLSCRPRPLIAHVRTLNERSIVRVAGADDEASVLHASYANVSGGILPFMILRHTREKAIVVSVRGTVTARDLITDLLSTPVDVSEWVPDWVRACGDDPDEPLLAHSGVVASATAVLAELARTGWLRTFLAAQLREQTASGEVPDSDGANEGGGGRGAQHEGERVGGAHAIRGASSSSPEGLVAPEPSIHGLMDPPPDTSHLPRMPSIFLRVAKRVRSGMGKAGRWRPPHEGPGATPGGPYPRHPSSLSGGDLESSAPLPGGGDKAPEDPSGGGEVGSDGLPGGHATGGRGHGDGRGRISRRAAQREATRCLAEPGWKVIVTGHSLGAAVACLLCLQLREHIAAIECWAFCPPGGLLSWRLSQAASQFCTSVAVGKDAISRTSLTTLKRAVDDSVLALARCHKPKVLALASLISKRNGRGAGRRRAGEGRRVPGRQGRLTRVPRGERGADDRAGTGGAPSAGPGIGGGLPGTDRRGHAGPEDASGSFELGEGGNEAAAGGPSPSGTVPPPQPTSLPRDCLPPTLRKQVAADRSLGLCDVGDISNEACEVLARYHAVSHRRMVAQADMFPPGRLMLLRELKAEDPGLPEGGAPGAASESGLAPPAARHTKGACLPGSRAGPPRLRRWDAVWLSPGDLMAEGIVMGQAMIGHHKVQTLERALASVVTESAER